MTTDSIDERRKALEEDFFRRQNEEALKRLQQRNEEKPRLSPITGEPMEQLTIMGVVVDRCPTSKGIWLDNGELEELLKAHEGTLPGTKGEGILQNFLNTLSGK